ncbi:hypothetical protein GKZ28_13185 [Clostridium chromiireducens]|uniref:GIY-YIG domain-containing protein n=1 Tax=Clostridium chromiireducens TaxID=225345 RepID=A0A964RMZ4_9CLOT|nr:GIY-YIG nuclease family protein [Clostridium chromiireducens]MVX64647.1 hypothetical protein [Clostridium chromiireducens]
MEDRKEVIEMELTIEQKQRKYEKDKEWRKNNPDKIKEYAKRSYEKNKEKQSLYYKEYYKLHKERILLNHKLWVEQKAIDSVYCFRDIDGNVLYWGSSSRFQERISSHLVGNSHLSMKADEMVSEWLLDKIEYQNYSQYNLSRADLYYIESYHKIKEKEMLKTAEVHYNENELTRSKEDLQLLADSLEFVEFDKLEKYLN